MSRWNLVGLLLLIAALLTACNLPETSATPASIITSTTRGSLPTVTLPASQLPPLATQSPTAAPSPTFPPVITATFPPATATRPSSNLPTATKRPGLAVTKIKMVDLNIGWAIGFTTSPEDRLIFKTGDGGKTWKGITPPEPNRNGKQVAAFFMDANRAWVSYSAPLSNTMPTNFTVWRTADGGTTWKSSTTSLSGLTFEHFQTSQIGFLDANHGWLWSVLGVGMSHTYIAMYTTSDSGATWKEVASPDKDNLPMSCGKNNAWFRDATHAYMAGNCYGVMKGLYLYSTNDGGATWALGSLPAPPGLVDAYTRDGNACGAEFAGFFDDKKGTLLVSCSDMNARKDFRWTYQTKDGGATWTSAALPRPFGSYFFLSQETGWYLGQLANDNYADVKVYLTIDGGKNWKEISATHWAGQQDYVDAKNGWVIASTGSAEALVRTLDGGLTYQIISPQLAP